MVETQVTNTTGSTQQGSSAGDGRIAVATKNMVATNRRIENGSMLPKRSTTSEGSEQSTQVQQTNASMTDTTKTTEITRPDTADPKRDVASTVLRTSAAVAALIVGMLEYFCLTCAFGPLLAIPATLLFETLLLAICSSIFSAIFC